MRARQKSETKKRQRFQLSSQSTDCWQELHKNTLPNLVVEVVKISRNKHVNVPHDFQHVQTLRKRWWDKGISTKWLNKTLKFECTNDWMDYRKIDRRLDEWVNKLTDESMDGQNKRKEEFGLWCFSVITCSRVWLGKWASVISKPYFCLAWFLISPYVLQSWRATVVKL